MGKFKLDEIDHQILDMLIDNTRVPFTDIAKKLLISAGTVHVRVKKMEDLAIIKGSSLTLDYKMLGYNFIAYVGILIDRSRRTYEIIEELKKKPYVTVAHITTGKYKTHNDFGLKADLKFENEIKKYSYMWTERGEYSRN